MDEEISIIDTKTRNEKIKNFFVKNKRILISLTTLLILLLLSIYSYQIYKDSLRKGISERYNNALIDFNDGDKSKVVNSLKDVIRDKDSTYSPLALYFLIDNNLIENKNEINDLFDFVINKISLENEIKNLIIYKKALFNAEYSSENDLLDIVNPLIKSDSLWKSHALYLVAEYFYSKGELRKSKEFFEQILNVPEANQDIVRETKKRLNRDLSE